MCIHVHNLFCSIALESESMSNTTGELNEYLMNLETTPYVQSYSMHTLSFHILIAQDYDHAYRVVGCGVQLFRCL